MNYFELQLSIVPYDNEISEILIAQFSEIGFDNFFENETGFNAYLSSKPDESEIKPIINQYSKNCNISYSITEVEAKNWNEEWESNINPLVIDDKCLIYTSFHDDLPECEYEILIDPKMSFGTGHHQTTEMMVKHILELDLKGKVVMDAGCGTGILAILASKKGAKAVVAFDYDDNCVENCTENVQKNNVTNITVLKADENYSFEKKFDIILANINRNVLINYSTMFSNLLNKNGILIVSGFYVDDINVLNGIYLNKFQLITQKELSSWCSLMYQKK